MGWRRLGVVFQQSGKRDWARSHAALPVPIAIGDDRFRVFFSARDERNRSSIGWFDMELSNGRPRLSGEAETAALGFGTPGMFDDSGASIGSIVRTADRDRIYYMGWNLGVVAPWRNSIGVAVGNVEEGRFDRLYDGPILDRSPEDPFTLSYPWVIRLADHDWRMWYGSNTKWGASSADMFHVIKSARSRDGLVWQRDEGIAVDASAPGEYALARPAVLYEDGRFRMWFAARGTTYKICYAESRDGTHWERNDALYGLAPSDSGWDSEMTCYPCPFRHEEQLYLAYNGNGYGKTGIGLAVWEEK